MRHREGTMNEHEEMRKTDEPERAPLARRRFLLGLVAAGLAYATPTLLGLDDAEAEPRRHTNRRRTRRTRPSNRRRTRRTRPSRRRPDRTRPGRTRPSRRPGRTRPSRRPGAARPLRPEPRDRYNSRYSRRDGRPGGPAHGGFNGPGADHRGPDGPDRKWLGGQRRDI